MIANDDQLEVEVSLQITNEAKVIFGATFCHFSASEVTTIWRYTNVYIIIIIIIIIGRKEIHMGSRQEIIQVIIQPAVIITIEILNY